MLTYSEYVKNLPNIKIERWKQCRDLLSKINLTIPLDSVYTQSLRNYFISYIESPRYNTNTIPTIMDYSCDRCNLELVEVTYKSQTNILCLQCGKFYTNPYTDCTY